MPCAASSIRPRSPREDQGNGRSGASLLVLPAAVVRVLGLPIKKSKIKVRYADGRRALRGSR